LQEQESASPKLSTGHKLIYGVGNFGINTAALIVASWALKRYCPPEKGAQTLLPVLWASIVYTAAKLTDGTAGPFLGYWSDNLRTRWGRRMPFIIFGTVPMCVLFLMIWVPPTGLFPPGSSSLFIYYCFALFGFWLLYTSIQTPLFSLLPEIALTNRDRLDLATYQSIFIMLSSMAGLVGAPVIKDKLGFPALGIVFTVLIGASVFAPALVLKERYVPSGGGAGAEDTMGLVATFRDALRNRPFAIFITSKLFAQIGFQAVIMALMYIVPTIFHKPDSYIGVIMGGTLVFTIISFFLIQKLAGKYSKKRINIWGLALMALLLPSIWFMGRFDLAFRVSAGGISFVVSELVIGFVIFTVIGFSVATQAVLMSPMIGDSTDLDEINTGQRREAVYFGLHGMVLKYGTALSGLLIGILFNRYGYEVGDHLGVDLVGPAAAACVFAGMLIFLFYPINKEEEDRIHREISARRR